MPQYPVGSYPINTVVATVGVGGWPMGVAYDSRTGEIFVTNFNSNSVSVINDTTDNVVTTVGVGTQPEGVAYDSGKGEMFVANTFPANCFFGCGQGTVSVISDATDGVVANITVGYTPMGVAYDGGKGEVFVTNSEINLECPGGTVSVISDQNNTVIATINVGPCPTGLAYDSGKGEVFVVGVDVSVINDTTDTVVGTIRVGAGPHAVAYDSAKGEVFVTNGGNVSVISDATDTVVANVSVGGSPEGVGYDRGRGAVFVANEGSNNVSVISDATDSVVTSVNVGEGPDAVVYDGGTGEVFVANFVSNSVSVILEVSLYPVTFTENGLPSTTMWYVNISSGPSSGPIFGYSSNYTVDLLNGSYTFSVGTTDASYRADGGMFKVDGASVSQGVIFSSTKAATFLGLPQAEGYAVLGGTVAAAITGVAATALTRRRVKLGVPGSASCRECGSLLRDGAEFCPSCGRPVR